MPDTSTPIFAEVLLDTPSTFTPAVALTAQQMFTQPYKYVFSFIVRVRAMGTATYVRLGNQTAQNYSLTVVGQTFEWAGNPGQVVDLQKLWVLSDTNDPVIEVIADYVPVYQISQVVPAGSRSM